MDTEKENLLREQIAHIEIIKSKIKASFKDYTDEQFIVALSWMGDYMNDIKSFVRQEADRRNLQNQIIVW